MSKPEMCDVEVWVIVDEEGDYTVGKSSEEAAEGYDSEFGLSNGLGTRRVKLTVKVPLPKLIELTGEVKAGEEAGELQAVS